MQKDLVAAFVLLAVAGVYYALATGIPQSALADDVGAAGLPVAYAVTLALLGAALLAKTLIAWRLGRGGPAPARTGPGGTTRRWLRAAGALALGAGYVAVVPLIGYLVSIAALIALAAWYQGERPGLRLAAIAIGGGVLFYLFFGAVLGVDVPTGFWPSLWSA